MHWQCMPIHSGLHTVCTSPSHSKILAADKAGGNSKYIIIVNLETFKLKLGRRTSSKMIQIKSLPFKYLENWEFKNSYFVSRFVLICLKGFVVGEREDLKCVTEVLFPVFSYFVSRLVWICLKGFVVGEREEGLKMRHRSPFLRLFKMLTAFSAQLGSATFWNIFTLF